MHLKVDLMELNCLLQTSVPQPGSARRRRRTGGRSCSESDFINTDCKSSYKVEVGVGSASTTNCHESPRVLTWKLCPQIVAKTWQLFIFYIPFGHAQVWHELTQAGARTSLFLLHYAVLHLVWRIHFIWGDLVPYLSCCWFVRIYGR